MDEFRYRKSLHGGDDKTCRSKKGKKTMKNWIAGNLKVYSEEEPFEKVISSKDAFSLKDSEFYEEFCGEDTHNLFLDIDIKKSEFPKMYESLKEQKAVNKMFEEINQGFLKLIDTNDLEEHKKQLLWIADGSRDGKISYHIHVPIRMKIVEMENVIRYAFDYYKTSKEEQDWLKTIDFSVYPSEGRYKALRSIFSEKITYDRKSKTNTRASMIKPLKMGAEEFDPKIYKDKPSKLYNFFVQNPVITHVLNPNVINQAKSAYNDSTKAMKEENLKKNKPREIKLDGKITQENRQQMFRYFVTPSQLMLGDIKRLKIESKDQFEKLYKEKKKENNNDFYLFKVRLYMLFYHLYTKDSMHADERKKKTRKIFKKFYENMKMDTSNSCDTIPERNTWEDFDIMAGIHEYNTVFGFSILKSPICEDKEFIDDLIEARIDFLKEHAESYKIEEFVKNWEGALIMKDSIKDFIIDASKAILINNTTNEYFHRTTDVVDQYRSILGRGALITKAQVQVEGSTLGSTKSVLLTKLLDDFKLYYNVEEVVFSPNDEQINLEVFNTFSGFVAKMVSEEDYVKNSKKYIDVFNKHLLEVLCNNDEQLFHETLVHFAHTCQHPGTITKKVPILIGSQRIGKNIILDLFLDYIIGRVHSLEVLSWNSITGTFNGALSRKMMVVLNEIPIYTDSAKDSARADAFKAMIDRPTNQLQDKYVRAWVEMNYCNYFGTTNNYLVIRTEDGQRRFLILDCPDKYKGNTTYFKNFADTLLNQEGADYIFTYLRKVEVPSDYSTREVFTPTKTNKNLQARMTGFQKFITTKFFRYLAEFDEIVISKQLFQELYEKFREAEGSGSYFSYDLCKQELTRLLPSSVRQSRFLTSDKLEKIYLITKKIILKIIDAFKLEKKFRKKYKMGDYDTLIKENDFKAVGRLKFDDYMALNDNGWKAEGVVKVVKKTIHEEVKKIKEKCRRVHMFYKGKHPVLTTDEEEDQDEEEDEEEEEYIDEEEYVEEEITEATKEEITELTSDMSKVSIKKEEVDDDDNSDADYEDENIE